VVEEDVESLFGVVDLRFIVGWSAGFDAGDFGGEGGIDRGGGAGNVGTITFCCERRGQ